MEAKDGARGSIAEGRRPKLRIPKSSEGADSEVGEMEVGEGEERPVVGAEWVLEVMAKGLGFVGRGAVEVVED